MESRLKPKIDRNDFLSINVKNILLEHSPLRRTEYKMEKVTARTEDSYQVKDIKEYMAQKMKRSKVWTSYSHTPGRSAKWISVRTQRALPPTRRSDN